MVCRQVERLLVKFIEGELSGKLKEEVAVHLDSCPGCRKERDLLVESWKALENYTAPKLKEDFTSSLMRRIHFEQAEIIKVRYKLPRFILRPLVPVLASAFVVVLVCLLFWKKPEEMEVATMPLPQPVNVATQAVDGGIIQKSPQEKEVIIAQSPEPINVATQAVDSGIIPEFPQEKEVVSVQPPEPVKVAILANDKEIIQNLDVLQNVELLQNMDVVNELDMLENFNSGISKLEHREA